MPSLSSEEKKELNKMLEEIQMLKEQARAEGRSFSAPSEEELKKKIKTKKTNSPYIYMQSWSHGPPGSTITYRVYIRNPDPTSARLFAYVFFGPANPVADLGEALTVVDERFPRLAAGPMYLSAGSSTNAQFTIKLPAVDRSVFLGNCFVFKGSYHDVGSYADRGFFYVNAT